MGGVDIILDDGAHIPSLQIATLKLTYHSLLASGGVYLCEDIVHTQYGEGFTSFVVNQFVLGKTSLSAPRQSNLQVKLMQTKNGTRLAREFDSVSFYSYATVIEKRPRPLHFLRAERHGSIWQPTGFFLQREGTRKKMVYG